MDDDQTSITPDIRRAGLSELALFIRNFAARS